MALLKKFHYNKTVHVFLFAFILGLVFAVSFSAWATTIGTNVSITGTLTTSGASTLNGAVTLGDAAADNILSIGMLNASSTLAVTGGTRLYGDILYNGYATSTAASGNFDTQGRLMASSSLVVTGNVFTYGNGTFGDAATDQYTFTGGLNATNTLAVTGVSRFYGNLLYNGYATTTASGTTEIPSGSLQTQGSLMASSTLVATGNVFTYGNGTFGDAATDQYTFTGGLNATNTLAVTGVSNLYGALRVNGYATTTASGTTEIPSGSIQSQGVVHASSSIVATGASRFYADFQTVNGTTTHVNSGGVPAASTTPSQELNVTGDIYAQSLSGTTTLFLQTEGTTGVEGTATGGCIQIRASDGIIHRIMVNGATDVLVVENGPCKTSSQN